MNSDVFMVYIFPFSIGVTGGIFFFIGILLYFKFSYRGKSQRVIATLVGFRKFDIHYANPLMLPKSDVYFEDYDDYVDNSMLLLKFKVKDRQIVCPAEWSTDEYGKEDIGCQLPIQFYGDVEKNNFRILLEGNRYQRQYVRGRKMIFGIFSGIGIVLMVSAILMAIMIFSFIM